MRRSSISWASITSASRFPTRASINGSPASKRPTSSNKSSPDDLSDYATRARVSRYADTLVSVNGCFPFVEHVALELCGAAAAVEQRIDLLRVGGRYLLVGTVFPGRPVELSAETVVRYLLRIEGMHNYTPGDLATAVEFLSTAGTHYPFAELVGARFPLTEADAAFRAAASGDTFRVAVVPE